MNIPRRPIRSRHLEPRTHSHFSTLRRQQPLELSMSAHGGEQSKFKLKIQSVNGYIENVKQSFIYNRNNLKVTSIRLFNVFTAFICISLFDDSQFNDLIFLLLPHPAQTLNISTHNCDLRRLGKLQGSVWASRWRLLIGRPAYGQYPSLLASINSQSVGQKQIFLQPDKNKIRNQ